MKYILIFMSAFFLASCSSSHRAPTLASTKATAVGPHKILGKAEAKEECYRFIFYYTTAPDFKKMRSKILEQAQEMGGDAVVDYSIRGTSSKFIYPFYVSDCYIATGTIVKLGTSGSAWDISPEAEQKPEPSVWD